MSGKEDSFLSPGSIGRCPIAGSLDDVTMTARSPEVRRDGKLLSANDAPAEIRQISFADFAVFAHCATVSPTVIAPEAHLMNQSVGCRRIGVPPFAEDDLHPARLVRSPLSTATSVPSPPCAAKTRTPSCNTTSHAVRGAGLAMAQFRSNPRLLAQCLIQSTEKYALDGGVADIDTAPLARGPGGRLRRRLARRRARRPPTQPRRDRHAAPPNVHRDPAVSPGAKASACSRRTPTATSLAAHLRSVSFALLRSSAAWKAGSPTSWTRTRDPSPASSTARRLTANSCAVRRASGHPPRPCHRWRRCHRSRLPNRRTPRPGPDEGRP